MEIAYCLLVISVDSRIGQFCMLGPQINMHYYSQWLNSIRFSQCDRSENSCTKSTAYASVKFVNEIDSMRIRMICRCLYLSKMCNQAKIIGTITFHLKNNPLIFLAIFFRHRKYYILGGQTLWYQYECNFCF